MLVLEESYTIVRSLPFLHFLKVIFCHYATVSAVVKQLDKRYAERILQIVTRQLDTEISVSIMLY